MPCSASFSFPATFSAGDSAAWPVTVADYPASAGWTLNLGAACSSPTVGTFVLTAQASGDCYTFQVGAPASALWKPGRYLFSLFVTGNGGQRITVGRGQLTVLPDPAAQALALDHAHKTLQLIEAALEKRIPAGLEETTIDGQMLGRIPLTQLSSLRDKYRAEVANLERAAAAAAGVPRRSTIGVRFVG